MKKSILGVLVCCLMTSVFGQNNKSLKKEVIASVEIQKEE